MASLKFRPGHTYNAAFRRRMTERRDILLFFAPTEREVL